MRTGATHISKTSLLCFNLKIPDFHIFLNFGGSVRPHRVPVKGVNTGVPFKGRDNTQDQKHKTNFMAGLPFW